MNPSSKPKKTPAPATPKKTTAAAPSPAEKKNKAAKAAPAPKPARAAKTPEAKKNKVKAQDKKPKLVHDSYSLPKDEDAALGALKRRVALLGFKVKKNSLLRAGLMALGKLGDTALLDALRALPEPMNAASASEADQPAKTKAAKLPKPSKKTTPSDKPATKAGSDATQAP